MSAASEPGGGDGPTRAVIVDDSRFMRTLIRNLLEEGGIEVVGEAKDGSAALETVREHDPDVVTMDIEMPTMNGLEAVEAIMDDHPTPVLMLSAHAEENADVTFEALDRGAVDFVTKPGGEVTSSMPRVKKELVEKVESAARVDLSANARASIGDRGTASSGTDREASPAGTDRDTSGRGVDSTSGRAGATRERRGGTDGTGASATASGAAPDSGPATNSGAAPDRSGTDAPGATRPASANESAAADRSTLGSDGASAATPEADAGRTYPDAGTLIVGASTGGPNVVERVLAGLPRAANLRVLVVQHMPEGFTSRFATRLDERSAYTVREAESGERIEAGEARVAPGGTHLLVTGDRGGRLKLELTDTEPIHGVRPAIDLTMASAVETVTGPLCGALLTGMGRDGVDGMERIGRNGGHTIAQDEATSAIFGMPRRAIDTGCVEVVAPAEEIAENALEYFAEE
ncbi:chemotaxis-specific protein-glutamate methyltransferase CheB [Halobellus litoreus]|uniref:Protein-glutamate methylesterase/protein-glutamine glutaminase n=1 Tax=Halobellus litoreus TaxID=755310 RepID=A0ABD6DU37_9EURY|nr:chemotaxis-specific protein-glutamate methyltransferase CheB [Halobellus litoreus]